MNELLHPADVDVITYPWFKPSSGLANKRQNRLQFSRKLKISSHFNGIVIVRNIATCIQNVMWSFKFSKECMYDLFLTGFQLFSISISLVSDGIIIVCEGKCNLGKLYRQKNIKLLVLYNKHHVEINIAKCYQPISPWTKGRHFVRWQFEMHFLEWKW